MVDICKFYIHYNHVSHVIPRVNVLHKTTNLTTCYRLDTWDKLLSKKIITSATEEWIHRGSHRHRSHSGEGLNDKTRRIIFIIEWSTIRFRLCSVSHSNISPTTMCVLMSVLMSMRAWQLPVFKWGACLNTYRDTASHLRANMKKADQQVWVHITVAVSLAAPYAGLLHKPSGVGAALHGLTQWLYMCYFRSSQRSSKAVLGLLQTDTLLLISVFTY